MSLLTSFVIVRIRRSEGHTMFLAMPTTSEAGNLHLGVKPQAIADEVMEEEPDPEAGN